jgi:hypothetical protein
VIPLRGSAEILGRLELSAAERILLVGAPAELEEIFARELQPDQSIRSTGARMLRSVKERFDLILLWQESRIGSRAALETALKRLEPAGRLWVATAMKKVTGPRTRAVHRLELSDLVKALEKKGMVCDRQARLSAWHVGYRFRRRGD